MVRVSVLEDLFKAIKNCDADTHKANIPAVFEFSTSASGWLFHLLEIIHGVSLKVLLLMPQHGE